MNYDNLGKSRIYSVWFGSFILSAIKKEVIFQLSQAYSVPHVRLKPMAKFEPEKKNRIIKTQHTQHYRDTATKGKKPISKQRLCL